MTAAEERFCLKCKKSKDPTNFCKSKYEKDGQSKWCRDCRNMALRKWRSENNDKQHNANLRRRWNQENRGKYLLSKKKYREKYPEKSRAQSRLAHAKYYKERYAAVKWKKWIKTKYGLTEEQFNIMANEQGHRCKVCKTDKLDGRRSRMCVDHCHTTGTVRGLLCFNCNVLLGAAKDDIAILESAIDYLKNFPQDLNKEMGDLNDFFNEAANEDVKCPISTSTVKASPFNATVTAPGRRGASASASTNWSGLTAIVAKTSRRRCLSAKPLRTRFSSITPTD